MKQSPWRINYFRLGFIRVEPLRLTASASNACTAAESAVRTRITLALKDKKESADKHLMIPESHPLQELFADLIHEHFDHDIGLRDAEIQDYIVNVLGEFCEAEQLFKVRDAGGRRLTDVGEMLLETDPIYGPAPSFDRERQVRKHIGDYTLFLSGMFPESINHYRLRRQRLESFVDFIRAGKESYYIVSKFDQFEYARLAPLFAKLARQFESCVYGLNLVKSDLEEMQHPIARQANDIVM